MRVPVLMGSAAELQFPVFAVLPGSPARMMEEKSGDLSCPCARWLMRLRFFSSAKGRLVSSMPFSCAPGRARGAQAPSYQLWSLIGDLEVKVLYGP